MVRHNTSPCIQTLVGGNCVRTSAEKLHPDILLTQVKDLAAPPNSNRPPGNSLQRPLRHSPPRNCRHSTTRRRWTRRSWKQLRLWMNVLPQMAPQWRLGPSDWG